MILLLLEAHNTFEHRFTKCRSMFCKGIQVIIECWRFSHVACSAIMLGCSYIGFLSKYFLGASNYDACTYLCRVVTTLLLSDKVHCVCWVYNSNNIDIDPTWRVTLEFKNLFMGCVNVSLSK